MKFYITFRQGSALKNHYLTLHVDSYDAAYTIARMHYPDSYSMVWSQAQWVDYRGESMDKRMNLKEIINL